MLRTSFDKRKFLIYFVVPLSTAFILMGMYFSGIRLLESIVAAPYFELVPGNSRREFGLLESLQHLLLVFMVAITMHRTITSSLRIEKAAWAVLFAFSTLIFLEEIDYGQHYYYLVAGGPQDQALSTLNLHNQAENLTLRLKQIVDAAMILFFIIGPFTLGRSSNALLRYVAPDPYVILTLAAGLITRSIAHALDDGGLGYGLGSNISEFRELITYYVFFLYLYEVGVRRESPARAMGGGDGSQIE